MKKSIFAISFGTMTLIATAIMFNACRQTQQVSEDAFITPPIPGLEEGFTVFQADAGKENTFSTPKGTKINIPAGIFTDEKGNPISGNVDIKYREYRDAADIYLSGIPMKYDTAGLKTNLETAGMFEIRGFQNGKPIFIKQGKSLEVNFASMTNDGSYNTYFLDESKRNWNYTGVSKADVNIEKKKLREKVAKMTPGLAFPLNSKYLALNMNAIVDVFYNNDWSKYDVNLFKSKMEKYGLGWTNIRTYSSIKFKGVEMPAAFMVWKYAGKTRFPNWETHFCCPVATPLGGNNYRMTVYNPQRTDSVSVDLEAIMTIQELFKFSPEYWESNYQTAMKRIETERERLATMADVYRSMEVGGFGIYNYDRLLKDENPVLVNAQFNFEGNYDKEVSDINQVIYIPGSGRSVIKLDKDIWKSMPLPDDDAARIFALLPDNKISIFPAKKFEEIDFDALRKQTSPAYTFAMQTEDKKLTSAEMLKKMLGL